MLILVLRYNCKGKVIVEIKATAINQLVLIKASIINHMGKVLTMLKDTKIKGFKIKDFRIKVSPIMEVMGVNKVIKIKASIKELLTKDLITLQLQIKISRIFLFLMIFR